MIDERFIELITKELIGELSSDEHQELQILIKKEPFYARQRNSFRDYWASNLSDKSADQALFQKITSAIREKEPEFNTEKDVPLKRSIFTLMWKAAAAVLIIGSSVLLYKTTMHGKANLRAVQAVSALRGERKIITLPDGTKVTINADSKLSFPSSFDDSTREVTLVGEAFFDVRKDAAHPFIIHTRKMDIRVLGTSFNVKAYPDDKFSETTLIRGIIQVKLADRPADRITLKPTEKLILNYADAADNGIKASLQKPSSLAEITYMQKRDTTVVETSWLQNKIIFKDQDFESLAKSLERRYNVSIQFENEATRELHFTGIFEKETITEALNALQLTENFNYKTSKDKIVIY